MANSEGSPLLDEASRQTWNLIVERTCSALDNAGPTPFEPSRDTALIYLTICTMVVMQSTSEAASVLVTLKQVIPQEYEDGVLKVLQTLQALGEQE